MRVVLVGRGRAGSGLGGGLVWGAGVFGGCCFSVCGVLGVLGA